MFNALGARQNLSFDFVKDKKYSSYLSVGDDNNHRVTCSCRFSLLSSKPVLCWSGVALGWSQ